MSFSFFSLQPREKYLIITYPIKHLQGCHKGDKVQGLHKLKLYLAKYGYLNYQHSPDHTNADEFDEELDAALKSYQNFYHLNATGVLDENTVSQMLVPRCGHPDKIIHQHGTNTLHTVSHYAFFPNKEKWPPSKSHLTYAYDSDYPRRYVPPVSNIQGADLKISFESPVHDDKNFELNHLAHAQAPPGGMFHYNTAFNWSVGPGRPVPNRFDLKTVALHEIGHLLGLEHSQDRNAIMFANIPPGAVKGLNFDDIQGIKVLYGIK